MKLFTGTTRTHAAQWGAFLLATACTLAGQSNTAPQKCKPKDAACNAKSSADTTATPKSAAEQFPFPVEDSKRGGEAKPSMSSEMPTTGVPDPPASSETPMHLPPGSSSSSSGDDMPGNSGKSSSSSATDDGDDVAPTTAAPSAPVKASPLKDLGSRGDTSAARAKLEQTRLADDLKVGKYYLEEGNTQGAYLRFKDAAEHAPDEPDARFGLAESASKLSKRNEAVLNYREYLRLDPGGDHDKAARKALNRLAAAAQ